MSTTNKQAGTLGIRWWPAALILTFAAAVWIWIWAFHDVDRQTKNLRTAGVTLVTLVLLLLWVCVLSRMPWRIRLLICGGTLGLIGFLAVALQIRGVTGDLVPVLQWRWEKPQLLPVEQAKGALQAMAASNSTSLDYPQIYGPNRNGKLSRGPLLARDWKARPPEELWRQPIGAAWSGFAVVGDYAVTMEQRGDQEMVVCYQLSTGDLLWAHADNVRYHTTIAGEGPRTVPTIVHRRVFTLGATGMLNCLELSNGELVWSTNIVTDNASDVPGWGVSSSPLVVDDMVIVNAGGRNGRSLVAYNVGDGQPVWAGGDNSAQHSSPVLADIAGVPQILIFNKTVVAHELNSGQVLWSYAWPLGHPHITMPVILPNDQVLVSSGYGTGSQLLQIEHDAADNWSASPIWESNRLKSKFANIVVYDGYIYGLDDGIFVCLDITDGSRQWKKGRYGHGQIILVNDVILVMSEKGDVVLLEPSPVEHRELTRFTALKGKTWNPPALADDYLLVRNDKEAACYRLPTVKP